MSDGADEELRGSDFFRDLDDQQVEQTLAHAQRRVVPSGHVICREGEPGSSMFLIASGRVKITVRRGGGEDVVLNYLARGNHFGELSMLIGGARSATVSAVVDTELLEITRDDFQRLVTSVPGFAANLSRTLSTWLRQEISGRERPEQMTAAAVVRSGTAGNALAIQIAEAWSAGQEIDVLSDRADRWSSSPVRSLHGLAQSGADAISAQVRAALSEAVDNNTRLLIDVAADAASSELLRQCEQVWWLVERLDVPRASADLEQLIQQQPKLAEAAQILAVQLPGQLFHEPLRHSIPVRQTDLQVATVESDVTLLRPADVSRLVHRLLGVQIGLALGGGGGRGLAHLGVLDVLESEGIYFDRIAGTSAGAMIGAFYAAGFDLAEMRRLLEREMTPPGWMRWLPQSKRWYLLGAFRYGLVERKIRRHLGALQFDQLLVPTHTVSVDLISGNAVVRQRGDVVDAVLESINHPAFGKPILRPGAALVDGGVLVNVPASVLRNCDVDYVVAVDVGSKLGGRFAGNTTGTPLPRMSRPSYLNTLFRVSEVQQRSLASLHMSQSDFLIAPDTSEFPFEDFTRGEELAEIGRQAAQDMLPQLKQALSELVRGGA